MDTKVEMVIPMELLGLTDIKMTEAYIRNKREIVIKVESTKEEISCRTCGNICKSHGHDRAMELRHLPMFGYKTFIQITPKRGICNVCDDGPTTTTQTLDWYERKARQTKLYEDHLLFELINSTVSDVSRKEEVDYHTIQFIIDKYIGADVDFSMIDFLGLLGIDEISLCKGRQKYVTIITYRHAGQVRLLKVLEGRNRDVVESFLRSIPEHLKQTVTTVCSDLYEGFINAAKAVFGNARITADRFHVAKLYRKKLITVRKSELKKLRKRLLEEDYKELKPAIAILKKGKDFFTEAEKKIIDPLFKQSPKLHLAYRYSHQLTTTFNSNISKKAARKIFRAWIENVSASELNCFKSFADTLEKYMNEITNYFVQRNSSGFVEGFNNRIKVLTRRSYGLSNIKRLFQRIKLDTEGLLVFRFSGT